MMHRLKRPASLKMLVVAMGVACALLLALPGETITTKYLNDLFIFLDGVHRVTLGQVPNRDFHTALGPLVYYVPAAGYWLSGSLGGAMPTGMALLTLILSLIATHVVGSRLRPAVGLPLALYLILVAAVPANLGESIGALSFGMFYNRIGWSALGLLLIMHLEPRRPHRHQFALDILCAAGLIVLMLYMKVSYGLAGIAFLLLMLLDPRQRRWALAALVLVLAAGLSVEVLWGGTLGHVADLALASRVSGTPKELNRFVEPLLTNMADYVLFTAFVVLALWRTRSVRNLLFLGFCAGAGFMLINQNFQISGIVALGTGAAVAAELLLRVEETTPMEKRLSSIASGAPLLLLALLLPPIVHTSASLALHAGLAAARYGEALPMPNFDRIRLARLWTEGDHALFTRYLASLEEGGKILAALGEDAGRVLVLDFVGPFSAGLGLQPPRGDSTWFHWGRTVDETNYLPPERIFRDVHVVMEPKWAMEQATADGLRAIYADHLAENYDLLRETAEWKVYIQRDLEETVSRSKPAEADPAADTGSANGG